MNFFKLFAKLKKQPIKDTKDSQVEVILEREYLEQLLKENKPAYSIPLELKFGKILGEQCIWFACKTQEGEN